MDNRIITVWKRIIAFLIDLAVLALLGGFIGFVSPPNIFSIAIFLIPIVQFIYFIGMSFVYGATIGKMLMKYSIVNINSCPISLLNAILREVVRVGPILIGNTLTIIDKDNVLFSNLALVLLVLNILILLSIFLSKKRRGIFEVIASTNLMPNGFEKYESLLKPKRKLSNKFSSAGAIAFVAIFIIVGRTSSRLFNAIIGAISGGIGAIIGIFFLDLLNRITEGKLPNIQENNNTSKEAT